MCALAADIRRTGPGAGYRKLPYVVVYRAPGRKAPLEVRLVSWRDHYVGLWVYDTQGRRTYDLDMQLLEGPSRLLRRSHRGRLRH